MKGKQTREQIQLEAQRQQIRNLAMAQKVIEGKLAFLDGAVCYSATERDMKKLEGRIGAVELIAERLLKYRK